MPKPVFELSPPYAPYFLESAVARISELIGPDDSVFEFGSGASTIWFAERVRRVVAVEYDAEWAQETERAARAAGVWSKVDLVVVDDENEIAPAIDGRGLYDLILVDCLDRQRVNAIKRAMPHVRPGRVMVVDDSQWGILRQGRKALKLDGWTWERFNGLFTRHNGAVKSHQTMLFFRPELEDEEE